MNHSTSVPFAFLVAMASAAAGSTAGPGERHRVELQEHYHHLAYIADFPCHVPQPRVIPVHEMFSETGLHGKAFFPDVTVLHRCDDHSGCCTEGHHCRPVHVDHLHLPFKVTFLEDFGPHKKGSWIMEYYHFDNHTECGCVEPPHDPCHASDGASLPHHSGEHHTPEHHGPEHHGEHHTPEHHGEHHTPEHHGEHHGPEHHGEHDLEHHGEHTTEHHHEHEQHLEQHLEEI